MGTRMARIKKIAIVAKVKEIAQSEHIPYCLDDDFKTKVKVLLRLSETNHIEMDIPVGVYQKTLKNLQTTLEAVKHLSERTIALKIKSSLDDDDEDEIEWEGLETEESS
jgi:hypothetical protein